MRDFPRITRDELLAPHENWWGIISHQELPDDTLDRIVPKVYYDKYPLIISHFNLDRIFVRIGMNEKQRQSIARTNTDIAGSGIPPYDSWDTSYIQVRGNQVQQPIISDKVIRSDHFIN